MDSWFGHRSAPNWSPVPIIVSGTVPGKPTPSATPGGHYPEKKGVQLRMPKIVFLCVANAARSQMAEGLARLRAPNGWEVVSAGSHPAKRVSSRAVTVMKEVGIDISAQVPRSVDDIEVVDADLVVTLCSDEVCPVVPGRVQRLHWPMRDPAAAIGVEADRLQAFRDVRDEIELRLSELWPAKR